MTKKQEQLAGVAMDGIFGDRLAINLHSKHDKTPLWKINQSLGPPREPQSRAEEQLSYCLGGDPQPLSSARHRQSKGIVTCEFHGVPADMDTPRLYKALMGLPFEDREQVGRSTVKVRKSPINGRATGHAEAQFRNVLDRRGFERQVEAARTSSTRSSAAGGGGEGGGKLPFHSFQVTYDNSRKVAHYVHDDRDRSLEWRGVPDDRVTTMHRVAYRGAQYAPDSAVPSHRVQEDVAEHKYINALNLREKRDMINLNDRRV